MDCSGTEPVLVTPRPAWGIKAPIEPVSLTEVMSEELAKSLQLKESPTEVWEQFPPTSTPFSPTPLQDEATCLLADDVACTDDEVIAQMLQAQFDREYDEQLSREETFTNGASKVAVSFSNYRRRPETYRYDSDDSGDEWEVDDSGDVDQFVESNRTLSSIPRCGYKKQGDEVITKHDITMTNRRNACRVMELPPGIETGDGGGFDMQLSNRVYNNLKKYSRSETKRRTRVHDKAEKSTNEMALDPKTRIILLKFVDNNLLEAVNGIISTGKEAVVLHADGGRDEEVPVPSECVVKIFKTTLNEFKNRDKYIKDDHRFKDRFSKQHPRKVIHMWAEKEMHNLKRLSSAGVPCPEVVVLRKHILVMSFIGFNHQPAPKLKEAVLSSEQWARAYEQVIKNMNKMYSECNLIHGDLSEYNVLWYNETCYFIDVSQSVLPNHPHALEFLFRDCNNVSNFFHRKGVSGVLSPSAMFHDITGLKITGTEHEALAQIQDYEENEVLTRIINLKEYPSEAFCTELSKCKKSPSDAKRTAIQKLWDGEEDDE